MDEFDIGQYAEFFNEYNVERLTELGFKSIPGHRRLLICPRCFGSVLGDVAEQHWGVCHQDYRYFTYIEGSLFGSRTEYFENESQALDWVHEYPQDIVMAIEVESS